MTTTSSPTPSDAAGEVTPPEVAATEVAALTRGRPCRPSPA